MSPTTTPPTFKHPASNLVALDALNEHLGLTIESLRAAGIREGLENNRTYAVIPFCDDRGVVLGAKRCVDTAGHFSLEWMIRPPALLPYGLERLDRAQDQRLVVFVDDIIEALVLGHHGVPALGVVEIPALAELRPEHLERIPKAFILERPGVAGAEFTACVHSRLEAIGYTGELGLIRLPAGFADVLALHRKAPTKFRRTFRDALTRAAGAPIMGSPKEDHGRRNASESRKLTAALKGAGLDELSDREVVRATWEAGGGRAVFALNYRAIATAAGKSLRWVEDALPRALKRLETGGLPLIRRVKVGKYNRHSKEFKPSTYDATLLREYLAAIEAERPVNTAAFAVIGKEVAVAMRTKLADSDLSVSSERPSKAPTRAPARPEDYARLQMEKLVTGVSERAVVYAYSPAREKAALLAAVSAFMTRIEELESVEVQDQERQLGETAALERELSQQVDPSEVSTVQYEQVERQEELHELEAAKSAGSNLESGASGTRLRAYKNTSYQRTLHARSDGSAEAVETASACDYCCRLVEDCLCEP